MSMLRQDDAEPGWDEVGFAVVTKETRMMKFGLAGGAIALSLLAAAPAEAQSAGHVLRGAGIGAAGGAVAGALIPGLGVGTGALVGAAGGAAYNGLINKGHHRHYYRHGRRYSRHHYRR
jgi:hypothetical protein